MAAVNPPGFLENGGASYTADILRRVTKLLRGSQGVATSTDMSVAQNGTPNMSVNVAAGQAAVDGTQDVVHQGTYVGLNDATANFSIAASDPTNPRIDIVVAQFEDSVYSGANNDFKIAVVTGSPAGSPVPPATPANAMVLAQVLVGATVTSIVNANITDQRTFVQSTGARGVLPGGYAEPSTTQGGITALTDLTNLAVTVTTPLNRRIRISASVPLGSSIATDTFTLALREGSTVLQGAQEASTGNAQIMTFPLTKVFLGDGAVHTYKLSAQRSVGTGTVTMQHGATLNGITYYANLVAEDIGT